MTKKYCCFSMPFKVYVFYIIPLLIFSNNGYLLNYLGTIIYRTFVPIKSDDYVKSEKSDNAQLHYL